MMKIIFGISILVLTSNLIVTAQKRDSLPNQTDNGNESAYSDETSYSNETFIRNETLRDQY